jgi:outer membrane protein OmpA-like peptidoglycan-associated protein
VHFESDRQEIRKDDGSEAVLFAVAKALRETPAIKRLEVQGHTDDQGDARYNQELSQRRAEAVRKWLVDAGVEPHRLVAKGYGKTQPLGGQHNVDQRADNRRVQFVVLATNSATLATADARP